MNFCGEVLVCHRDESIFAELLLIADVFEGLIERTDTSEDYIYLRV